MQATWQDRFLERIRGSGMAARRWLAAAALVSLVTACAAAGPASFTAVRSASATDVEVLQQAQQAAALSLGDSDLAAAGLRRLLQRPTMRPTRRRCAPAPECGCWRCRPADTLAAA